MAFLLSNLTNKNYQLVKPEFGDLSTLPSSSENLAIADSVQSQLDKQAELAKKQKLADALSTRFKEMNPAYTSAVKGQMDARSKVGSLQELQDLYKKDEETKIANASVDQQIAIITDELDKLDEGFRQLQSDSQATQNEFNQLDPNDFTSRSQLQSELQSYKNDMDENRRQYRIKIDKIASLNKNAIGGFVGGEDQTQQLELAQAEQLQADKNLAQANETNPYGIYSDIAQVDPMLAFKEHNDLMQKQASSKLQSDWDTANKLATEIDTLYTQNLSILRNFPDGQIPKDQQAVLDNNISKIGSLSGEYTKATNGKIYKSIVMDNFKAIASTRKDANEAEKFSREGAKMKVETDLKLGDKYDNVVKEATNYVQESQYAKDIKTMAVIANQIKAMKDRLGSKATSNPAYVRAIVVAFNKFLEPSSAVMEGDFKSTAGIPDKGVSQIAQEISRIMAIVKGGLKFSEDPKVQQGLGSDGQYILSPAQAYKVEQSFDAIKGIVPKLQTQLYSAGATEMVSRLGNPHYQSAGLAQIPFDTAKEMMKKASGLEIGSSGVYSAPEIELPENAVTSQLESEKTSEQLLKEKLAKELKDKQSNPTTKDRPNSKKQLQDKIDAQKKSKTNVIRPSKKGRVI